VFFIDSTNSLIITGFINLWDRSIAATHWPLRCINRRDPSTVIPAKAGTQ
jgi:hypothetical protein